jgi:hypothetical protein
MLRMKILVKPDEERAEEKKKIFELMEKIPRLKTFKYKIKDKIDSIMASLTAISSLCYSLYLYNERQKLINDLKGLKGCGENTLIVTAKCDQLLNSLAANQELQKAVLLVGTISILYLFLTFQQNVFIDKKDK